MTMNRAGWQTKTLGEVAEIFADGDWVESKDQSTEGVRLIQTGNVGEGVFKDRGDKARYISEATFKRLRCTEIFEGDCLISRLPDPVGRSCLLPDTGERMITAVDCTIVRFDSKQIIPVFFNYYSQSTDYLDAVDAETSGTTRNRISRSNLGKIAVPVPPLPEQQRIVGILDAAFDGIAVARANAEANLKNARALFESHLQSVFEQRGEGWVTETLGNICEVKDGTHDSPRYVSDGIPFVTQKNVREDGLTFAKTKFISNEDHAKFYKRSNVARGDVLISMIGANRGMACLVDDERVFSIKNVCLVKANKALNQKFLLYFLKSSQAVDFVRSESKGGAQEFIGLTELRKFPIATPELRKQETLVAKFDELSTETQRLASIYQQKLAALDELKKSLLHQAFSGML
ncbi:MAG: restriction endonuclease subunit S [Gallionella sp.]|nr:restriction endonuclease subunit S [Gallionella sp.]